MPPAQAPHTSPPSPAGIFDILNGFQSTAVLKTAIELDFFSQIAAGVGLPADLAAACGCSERGARSVCDGLAILGLLEKSQGHYRLTPDSATFLDRRSPAYMGSVAEFLASGRSVEAFARLTETVRRGGADPAESAALEPDSPVWVNFARNMGAMQRFPAQALAELLLPKPTGPCKVLDIASGHGLFGIAMAQRHPGAEIYALDWPAVLAVTEENAAAARVTERIHLIPGSAFEADLGEGYNWVLIPNFLHHFDPATNEAFLKRVKAALAPDGEVAILEFVPDEDRLSPRTAAWFSLIMLTSTPAGDAYTFEELDRMLRNAGFTDTELHPLPPSFQRVVIAAP